MGTYIVGAIVLVVLILAGYKAYTDRKRGKGCGGGCDGCSACPNCEKKP